MTAIDWLAPSRWRHRSAEFWQVKAYDDGRPIVVMEFEPQLVPAHEEAWSRVRALWLNLPTHPNILDAVDTLEERGLLLRYAALDWKRSMLVGDLPRDIKRAARWGAQLSHAFSVLALDVPAHEAGWLLNPLVKIDLDDHVRVGFLPISPDDKTSCRDVAHEVLEHWPRCEEPGLVYLIGRLLPRVWVRTEDPASVRLAAIVARCLDPDPAARWSLNELRMSLLAVDGRESTAVRRSDHLVAWNLIEEGIGWLEVAQPKQALVNFMDALAIDPGSRVAQSGRFAALDELGLQRTPFRAPLAAVADASTRVDQAIWGDAEPEGKRLEAQRQFGEALAVYRIVRPDDDAIKAAVFTAMARCHLALGQPGHAIDYAGRAIAVDAQRTDARFILIRGLLLGKQPQEALRGADGLLELLPGDGAAHHERGRCLFALGRLLEARDSFERATTLEPRLLEAMLLRREVDRCLRNLRQTVGTEVPRVVELPEHLAELRSALVNGRAADAIVMLQGPSYSVDPVAQLLLGSCLRFEGRLNEALPVYGRVAGGTDEHRHTAMVGLAHVLIDLDQVEEALKVLDLVRAERPDHADVMEGRAIALERLGRTEEAAEEHRRFVAAAQGRSDLRARSEPPRHGSSPRR